jgi:ribosome-associated protein
MVLATGTSPRQMRTVCDDLAEMAEQRGEHALGTDGIDGTREGGRSAEAGAGGGGWMLIDFVNVVCHVFSQDARAFYDLDSLWGDAKKVEVPLEPPPAAAKQ